MIDKKRVLNEFFELVSIRCSTLDERAMGDARRRVHEADDRLDDGLPQFFVRSAHRLGRHIFGVEGDAGRLEVEGFLRPEVMVDEGLVDSCCSCDLAN